MTVTTIQPDAAAGKDTVILEYSPTSNYGADANMRIGSVNVPFPYRGLIQFPTSDIPAGSVIDSVTLSMYKNHVYWNNPTTEMVIYIRRLLQPWTEGGATWRTKDGSTAWDSYGASTDGVDRMATPSASLSVDNVLGPEWLSTSSAGLASDFQGWLDGDFSNCGWLLQHEGEHDPDYYSANRFSTSDAIAAQRPKLTVTHHTPEAGGIPPHLLQTVILSRGVIQHG